MGGEGVRRLISLLAVDEDLECEEPDLLVFFLLLPRRSRGEQEGEEDEVCEYQSTTHWVDS